MRKSSPLPPTLRYLEPVREQLAALKPGEISEDTDLSILRKVVRKRVKELSPEDARTALNNDGAELTRWLAAPERQNEPLHFLVPFLAMDVADVLLVDPAEPSPEREVYMELPDWCRVTKGNGYYGVYWNVKWRKLLLDLLPVDDQRVPRLAQEFHEQAARYPLIDNDGTAVAEVRFGEVSGFKCTEQGNERKRSKRVLYALDVPGGHVAVTIGPELYFFDESEIEAYLRTLRVIPKHP